MKHLFAIFLALFALSASASVADDWAIIPAPQKIELTGGELSPSDITYIDASDTDIPVLYGELDRLPHAKRKGIGVKLTVDSCANIPSDEGYVLKITPRLVSVEATGDAGLFYGCVTLNQLMTRARETGKKLPAMTITDSPAIAMRAVHFDTKHHLDRMKYYYDLIDWLAGYKVNTIIWEVDDKLQYESHPECSSPNAISKQEMQALSRYARDRHIAIEPLIQGLGHASYILKNHWELRENPLSDWEFCPSNPDTYRLQFDLYRDALEAMPYGKLLHVGGDEITAIGIDQRCKATGKSPFELQMQWLEKVCGFALEHHRKPVFWDDMALKQAGVWDLVNEPKSPEEAVKHWKEDGLDEAVKLFPDSCVFMRWNYDDPTAPAHIKLLDWYGRNGVPVFAATSANQGIDVFIPRRESNIQNIKAFCRLVADNKLEGIFATNWEDGSPHWETVARGFAALGEYGWNPYTRSKDKFKSVYSQREFGLPANGIDFIDLLERSAYFFDKALAVEGRRNPAYQVWGYKLLGLPDKENPGQWSRENKLLLDSARVQVQRYDLIKEKISYARDNALRHRYTLDVYGQCNELFNYPAKILLALENADMGKAGAMDNLKKVCDDFDAMRREYEKIYSETRFMVQPNGYIFDMNHHHHLSARTPDSSWIFLYEIPFVQSVREWLDENKNPSGAILQ